VNGPRGRSVRFVVRGLPRPQGSLSAWGERGSGRVRVVHAGGIPFKRWRSAVSTAALMACVDSPMFKRGVVVVLEFRIPRPARNTDTDCHDGPDIDKLARAVLDAMSGVVYEDDRQVGTLHASKAYANTDNPAGVWVSVEGVPS